MTLAVYCHFEVVLLPISLLSYRFLFVLSIWRLLILFVPFVPTFIFGFSDFSLSLSSSPSLSPSFSLWTIGPFLWLQPISSLHGNKMEANSEEGEI